MFSELKSSIENEDGAIDLASIMVGIIVIGIIGGLISATVFAVIPWTQDEVAKSSLKSVQNAQNAYAGLSADPAEGSTLSLMNAVTIEQTASPSVKYASSVEVLTESGLFPSVESNKLTVATGETDACYVAMAKSDSGKLFWASNTTKPAEYKPDISSSDCAPLAPLDEELAEQPEEEQLPYSEFTVNCFYEDHTAVPLRGFTGKVEWSDGEVYDTEGATVPLVPERSVAPGQTYTVKVYGTFTGLGFPNDSSTPGCLTGMPVWAEESGTIDATNAFRRQYALSDAPASIPSTVTSLESAFQDSYINDPDISNWDVSNVTNMSYTFYAATAFDQPLNNWNVSNVTDMSHMFDYAFTFNQDLGNWNTSKVTDMSAMFASVQHFNYSLDNWNVSNVTDMSHMFDGATTFNNGGSSGINNWDVSNVTNMFQMFDSARAFNQPLNNWDVSNVTNMGYMFLVAQEYEQNISSWNVTNVTTWEGFAESSPLETKPDYIPAKFRN